MNDSRHRTVLPHASSSILDLRQFEWLLAELSSRFVNLPAARTDDAIVDALQRIVVILGVDRSVLIRFPLQVGEAYVTHSWSEAGVPTVAPKSLSDSYPWTIRRLRAGHSSILACLDDLPPEAIVDKLSWQGAGVKSNLAIPMRVAGQIEGAISFGCLGQERAWPEELVTRVGFLADVFANALAHKRAQEDLELSLGFERLLVDISAALIRQRPSDLEVAVTKALRAIGEFLLVERTVLWRLSADGERFEPTHSWVADGEHLPPAIAGKLEIPTIFRRVLAGDVVTLASIDELPPEADADRQLLRRLGTHSLLVVPLGVEGFIVGALSLASVSVERAWPEGLIPRVRLMGEVFASLLTRQRSAVKVQEAQTETTQYRERLAHLVRVHTIGEMSAAIAHEVNQPLVAIENYALAARRRLATEGAVDSAKLGELLDKIGGQAARAGDVLMRLRSIVKKHESELTEFDVGALVTDTVNLVGMESRLADVRVETVVTPGLPQALADEIQIQQVVLNLARNAIEAMDAAGISDKVLRVEVQKIGDGELVVRIIDRGPGVSSSDAEHVFEPFFSTKTTGLGIGLAICRSIVEAHGGKLTYAPNPGGGAVFQFTLPTADDRG